MIRAVYDCNVVLSGIGWNGSARKCLKLVAKRRVFLSGSKSFSTDRSTSKSKSSLVKFRVAAQFSQLVFTLQKFNVTCPGSSIPK